MLFVYNGFIFFYLPLHTNVLLYESYYCKVSEKISEQIQNKFYSKLGKFLSQFNYEITEENEQFNWIADFNKENLIKSIELHEQLNNEYLTSSFFSIKIG